MDVGPKQIKMNKSHASSKNFCYNQANTKQNQTGCDALY